MGFSDSTQYYSGKKKRHTIKSQLIADMKTTLVLSVQKQFAWLVSVAFFVKKIFDALLMGGDPVKIFVEVVFGEFAESEKIGFTHPSESNRRES